MVTIASLDLASVNNTSSTSVSLSSKKSTANFSNTLQATQVETQKATNDSGKVAQNKEEVKSTEESSSNEEKNVVLSLEYLLASTKVSKDEKTEELIDFSALFQATSVEDLVKLMGGKSLPEGEQLNLTAVADALGLSENDLQNLIQKMTGNQQQSADLWDALDKIDQNLFPALQQISAAVNGHTEAKLTTKEAQQAIALFKLVQLAGPKTDLALKQESQVAQMKNWVNTLSSQINVKVAEKEVALPFAKTVVRFTPVSEAPQIITQTSSTTEVSQKIQTVTIQLPTTSTQSQAAKFVEQFQSVMNRAQFASNAAGARMLIKLYPEHLGTIRIELIQKDGLLSAKLLASNPLGKQMLDSTLQQLKQGLANQNIQIDRVDVAQALNEPNKGERGQQFTGQQSSNERQSEKDGQNNNEEEQFSFDELLARLEE